MEEFKDGTRVHEAVGYTWDTTGNGFKRAKLSGDRCQLLVHAWKDRPGIEGDHISILVGDKDRMASFAMDETMAMKLCDDLLSYIDRRRKERQPSGQALADAVAKDYAMPEDIQTVKMQPVPLLPPPVEELPVKPQVVKDEKAELASLLSDLEFVVQKVKAEEIRAEPAPVLKEDRHIVLRKRRAVQG